MLKQCLMEQNIWIQKPAAFGRLCVETKHINNILHSDPSQPPSGGCVLKQAARNDNPYNETQPPSGGCVLKLSRKQKL